MGRLLAVQHIKALLHHFYFSKLLDFIFYIRLGNFWHLNLIESWSSLRSISNQKKQLFEVFLIMGDSIIILELLAILINSKNSIIYSFLLNPLTFILIHISQVFTVMH